VCTHGTRDACCARLGRPLAQAFAALEPAGTWEISHSGGHRFAGVALDLAGGLAYGRVGVTDAAALVDARRGGRVVTRLLRGALYRTPAAQAAESALREHLGEDRVDALALSTTSADGATTTWRHRDGAAWTVACVEEAIAARPASCGKQAEPASAWRAVSLRPSEPVVGPRV
jgi:hypothetical protein